MGIGWWPVLQRVRSQLRANAERAALTRPLLRRNSAPLGGGGGSDDSASRLLGANLARSLPIRQTGLSLFFFRFSAISFFSSSWTVCVCDLFRSRRFRFARCPPGRLAKFPTRARQPRIDLYLINQAELRSRVKIAPCQSIPTTTLYLHLDPLCRRPHGPHP